ncbi:acyltransferase [Fluviicola chungangensis]|uniref:Acyltransferase n=1 Tax=Fluviicola chungangensis TaxID=2597671 RepID=A0A556N1E8_9FLAO|nr:acyltransferase [Fluviicola chungangensis]
MVFFVKLIRNVYLKHWKWRRFQIGKNFHAGRSVQLWAKNNISIGNDFYIGRFSQIENDAVIGNHVIMGNHVALVGKYDHHYQQPGTPIRLASAIRDKDYNWKGLGLTTTIEDDVWVGYGSTIMQGVTIHQGSIIAAGSVVTKDVEAYSIYGGNPARKIANRFNTPEELERHCLILQQSGKKNE